MGATGHFDMGRAGKDRQLGVGDEFQHVGCVLDADEVLVADQDERGARIA
jgi:hypothetical protein